MANQSVRKQDASRKGGGTSKRKPSSSSSRSNRGNKGSRGRGSSTKATRKRITANKRGGWKRLSPKRGKRRARGRTQRREFPANLLYAAGWLFIPVVILPLEWKRLSSVARTVGVIWTLFYLWWMVTRVYLPQG